MKNLHDMKATKQTRTVHLAFDGKYAGAIYTTWSTTFGTCYANVSIWAGPAMPVCTDNELREERHAQVNGHGSASGGGYCRESAAVAEAMEHGGIKTDYVHLHGCGTNRIHKYFEQLGYLVMGF
jgi:hypothetical protein